MNKDISIVLGSFNRKQFLKLTIDSIRQEMSGSQYSHEIIVIDGGSTDGSLSLLIKQKDIITIVQHNRGVWKGNQIERHSWGYFMNLGFKSAQGKYICMLSDDCIVVPGAIKNGIEHAENEIKNGRNVGAISFYWRNWPEQKKYWVGLTLGNKMFVNHGLYLRKAMEDVKFIDEDTFGFYHADGDVCLKMWQAGYEVVDSPHSYIEHFSHANVDVRKSNNKKQEIDWNTYLKKWEGIYYFDQKKNIGSWIEKEYIDETNSGNRFRFYYLFNYGYMYLKRILLNICGR